MKNQIYPCLWFDGQAKAAAEFYCSVFADSKITYDSPMVVNFELAGQKFMALNGGPQFQINPSISFFVLCETMSETDTVWQKLSEGGMVMMPLDKYDWSEKYGWLQDKFGVSWQISFGKMEDVGQKFTPSLMFTQEYCGKAEEALNFYISLFPNSSLEGILHFKEGEDAPVGTVAHAQFKLNDNVMMVMDSPIPHNFKFNEGVSLVVNCANQQEINHFWDNFTREGEESMCGWLKDKFGVSWQILPSILGELMNNPEKAPRVGQALMQMKKLDLEALINA